jgi:molecular chaperone DnaK (HSP70)
MKYAIGIDLGTTNSVLAYALLDADRPQVELLPIPQLVAAATVESRSMLPSFLYLAARHESPAP